MSKERKRVLDRRDEVYFSDLLDGRTIEDVILELQSMLRRYEEEIFTHDKEVKFETEHYGYDGGMQLYVRVMRWESDREYEARMAKEQKERAKKRAVAQAKKDKEYAEYERLKKKFEGVQ